MLSKKQIFDRLQWGYEFDLTEGDKRFSLKNENLLSANCFGKNGYVFIHLHRNMVRPHLSSLYVTIYDRKSNKETRAEVKESNYREIKNQINSILR